MHVEMSELKVLSRRDRRNVIRAMLALGKRKEKAARRERMAKLKGVASQVLARKDRKALGL